MNSKIGWIGLGRMGTPMSAQLIKAGYTLGVFNRTREKEKSLIEMGAIPSPSPAALITDSDIVILMIADDTATREIFEGKDGLLSANVKERLIINMSTVSPLVSKEMDVLVKAHGNHLIDAPVSGSVKQAQEGQLVIMAGGEEENFQKAKPVLEVMGKLALRVGEAGAGNTAKLAINALLGFYAQGLAEAVILAENNGIRTEDLMTLINNAALGNIFTKIKGDAILQDNFQAAFALKHIAKDIGLASDIGLNTPLGKTALQTYTKALSEFGEEDIIAVLKYLRKQS